MLSILVMNLSSTEDERRRVCLLTSCIPMLWRKYKVGRRRDSTLQASSMGRWLITRRRSDPLTFTSRRRKVKTGRTSFGRRVRICGHIRNMRQSSATVKPKEERKSLRDLRSSRLEEERVFGWRLRMARESRPIESRKRAFSSNSTAPCSMGCDGGGGGGVGMGIWGSLEGLCGSGVAVREEMMRNLSRGREGKSWELEKEEKAFLVEVPAVETAAAAAAAAKLSASCIVHMAG
ncbi:hypothetical protein Dimus_006952 [Dionaea muscipula]